jgi:hypothetical protein
MFRKFTAFSPTVKNRYEILFFNKEALCAMMSSIKKNNNSSSGSSQNNNSSSGSSQNNNSSIPTSSKNTNPSNPTSLQNTNPSNPTSLQNTNLNNVNNTSLSQLKSELDTLSKEDLANIEKEINNINISKYKIDFKENEIINYYNILKDCSYLRLYFKYTDDKTLEERFKKTGKKDFNYVQKYNISTLKLFFDYFIRIYKTIKNYKEIENNYKKLDKSTQTEIDDILNRKVNSEKDHYTNIKEVLEIIKGKTGGSINYFMILDIKKSKLMSINSITKKTNSNNKTFNNKTFQTGGRKKKFWFKKLASVVPLYITYMYIYYYIYHASTTKNNPNSIWYCLGKAGMEGNRLTPSECMHSETRKRQ